MTTGKFGYGMGAPGSDGADGADGSDGIGDIGVVGQLVWLPVDNPSPGDTVTIAGTVYEFDGDGTAGIPITIGETADDTLANLANQINAGVLPYLAMAVDGPALALFTADGPGGTFASAANPAVSASEPADVWTTINIGRAANQAQASGRVVFTDITVAEAFAVWFAPGFEPAFVDWRLYSAAGAQIADATLTVVTGSGENANAITIDPTVGVTPPSAGDVLVFTAYA